MASHKHQSTTILLSFLLLTLFQHRTSSSPSKLSYIDHCEYIVPHATVTSAINLATFISFSNSYISGGDELLEPYEHPSPEVALSISLPFYYFYTQNLHMTRTSSIIKVEGSLHLEGRTYINSSNHYQNNEASSNFGSRKMTIFQLSGFWSKPSGKICMVGSGFVTTKQGTSLNANVVFKLNYPYVSDISTCLVNGTVESLDTKDSPAHFEQMSILAYAQNNYSYSKIPQAKFACRYIDVHEELLGFGDSYSSTSVCNSLQSLFNVRFELEYGKACSILNCTLLGFEPTHMVFDQFGCSEDGKVHIYIGFPIERNHDYSHGVTVSDKTLVGEGFWDPEKRRLCLVAFPILIRKNSPVEASVSNAAFGISLWIPGVMTIESRSTLVGRIWSKEATSRYISFRSSDTATGFLGGMRYEYTRTQSVIKYCESNGVGKLGTGRYPDGNIIGDLRFDIVLTNHEGFNAWGFAHPLSFGENFYGDSYEPPNTAVGLETTLEEMSTPVLSNVSYKLSYTFFNKSSEEENTIVEISAEGIYNAGTGTICLVGCRDLYRKSNGFPMDCNILINIQLTPMNPGDENGNYPATNHLNGTIQSTRAKEDPLYFEPLNVSSHTMYTSEAIQEARRMDIEIIMVLISLTFPCIFIALQLFHIKRHPEVIPSVSITMVIVLTLGLVAPMLLNLEAFSMNRNTQNVLLRTSRWIEVNEVIVRLMTLLAFLLQFSLLQSACDARSSDENERSVWFAELKTLGFCLILYSCGALVAWSVHKSSYQTPLDEPTWVEERNNHSIWLMSYAGLLFDGFLLPQIVFNMISNCTNKALSPFYYVGITIVRALPHLYDTYRAHYYVPSMDSAIIFARPNEDLYSSAWNFIIPLEGVLFAVLIFFQQNFGGRCFLPKRFKNLGGYEISPVAIP